MKIPLWSMVPFLGVLLSVAILPTLTPRFWRKYHILLLSTLSIPIFALSAALNIHWVFHAFTDYVSFICLLGALYAIGGSLYVHGIPKANPVTNTGFMILGGFLASLIGTLGASMLLIRPLIRSNRGRKHEVHVIVFFIFIVSNIGGLLTPLGDPPLLLGYLMGVPFWWTVRLAQIWGFTITSLIGVFLALDGYFYLNDPDFRGPLKQDIKSKFNIVGKRNLLLIPLIIAGLIFPQKLVPDFEAWQVAIRVFTLVLVIYICHKMTPRQILVMNNFTWEPFEEVAIVFAAIFVTMVPTIKYLELHALEAGLSTPWGFFWISGVVSGILDNAPTYAAFFALAQGLGKDFATLTLENGKFISEPLLIAISCGSVFFGAATYLGNGPNLLIKAVAEEERVRMPSFFGYLLWSVGFLLPILFLVAVLFFE